MGIRALILRCYCFASLLWRGTGQNGGGGGSSQQSWDFFRIVNASIAPVTIQYAYAPSMILKDGVYHVFFCSGGKLFPAWDYIRYVKSTDGGQTWSDPVDMLRATAFNGNDLAACDPSVVFFQGFYYMYYGSANTTGSNSFQTVVQVARSTAIDGPYLTYTQRGTWEDLPDDPQVIIKPLVTRSHAPTGYGAGQPSVVVLNGKLLMWYNRRFRAGSRGGWRLYDLSSVYAGVVRPCNLDSRSNPTDEHSRPGFSRRKVRRNGQSLRSDLGL
jgi:hypothetical protein